ncbi:MAG: hypothetical protein LBN93_05575 [Candidatus Symbiothrix sp.]|jgi:hypothetical protein|nr:hypothetical protein [Candidatus Symbiothrix sp.]
MDEEHDFFNDFQQSMRRLGGDFHILETIVPVEKQMEYFKYSEHVRAKNPKETVAKQLNILQSDDSTYEELKYALTYLATSGDVAAYRAIETFSKKEVDPKLTEWTSMSLMQARLTMDAEFLNEKQVFISTGLGGKGNKFRFYAFFRANHLTPFSDYQRRLIEKEFAFSIEKNKGEVEKIDIGENYFSILFLMDMLVDVRYVLVSAADTCNEFGEFIDPRITITNVKIYDAADIQKELRKQ